MTHRVSPGALPGKNLCSLAVMELGAARECSTVTMDLLHERQLCFAAGT